MKCNLSSALFRDFVLALVTNPIALRRHLPLHIPAPTPVLLPALAAHSDAIVPEPVCMYVCVCVCIHIYVHVGYVCMCACVYIILSIINHFHGRSNNDIQHLLQFRTRAASSAELAPSPTTPPPPQPFPPSPSAPATFSRLPPLLSDARPPSRFISVFKLKEARH